MRLCGFLYCLTPCSVSRFLFIYFLFYSAVISVREVRQARALLHGRKHLGLMWNILFASDPQEMTQGSDQAERLGISGVGGLNSF